MLLRCLSFASLQSQFVLHDVAPFQFGIVGTDFLHQPDPKPRRRIPQLGATHSHGHKDTVPDPVYLTALANVVKYCIYLRLHDNAIGVLIYLVFLAFSILLYHLLTHVRTTKIVINFTPIVKDFSSKLQKNTNFSQKAD